MKVVSPAPDNFKLVIEFNRAECEALYTVSGRVGGPIGSGCGHSTFDDLRRILRDAGIDRQMERDNINSSQHSFYFK